MAKSKLAVPTRRALNKRILQLQEPKSAGLMRRMHHTLCKMAHYDASVVQAVSVTIAFRMPVVANRWRMMMLQHAVAPANPGRSQAMRDKFRNRSLQHPCYHVHPHFLIGPQGLPSICQPNCFRPIADNPSKGQQRTSGTFTAAKSSIRRQSKQRPKTNFGDTRSS